VDVAYLDMSVTRRGVCGVRGIRRSANYFVQLRFRQRLILDFFLPSVFAHVIPHVFMDLTTENPGDWPAFITKSLDWNKS
jgi:hypothetical protein